MGVQDTFGDISATAAAIIAHKWAESGALTIGLMLCLYPQVQAKLKQVSAVSSPQPVPVLSEDIPSSPVVTWSADCACRSHCHNCDDCHRVSADHSVDSVSCVTSDGKKRKLALIVALIVIYSLITPCGVFCGALIDNIVHGSTALYVQGSLNAIASGDTPSIYKASIINPRNSFHFAF
ncbi:hypothetical protein Pelo_1330 [Pelomyxa schiedti]|nr:hypothetical protein Pelo_1330 [Pelomyxa schiedti]